MAAVEVIEPPTAMWRVARAPNPLAFSEPFPSDQLDSPHLGNRFDSPTGSYRVLYFATNLSGCYGETLARFRPDAGLLAIAQEPGFMMVGEVPADWRHRRVAVNVRIKPSATVPHPAFLDVESAPTRAALREELAPILAYYGYDDLDVPTVRGADRRITRWIGQWAFDQRNGEGRALYGGIRYLSRLSTDWECWAVFEGVSIEELSRQPIRREDAALQGVATLFRLNVF